MRIESLQLKNCKSFRNARMENISPRAVVVGLNGAGRTTLFRVFGTPGGRRGAPRPRGFFTATDPAGPSRWQAAGREEPICA